MFSDKEQIDRIEELSGWRQIPCLEVALLEDRPLSDCFGINGIPVCYWPRDLEYSCCNHWLIIDLDYLELPPRIFCKKFQEFIKNCGNLSLITICGSADKLSNFGITSYRGRNSSRFEAYIAGINAMRGEPVVVETKAVLGRGPSKEIVTHYYS